MSDMLEPVRRNSIVASVRQQLIDLINKRALGPGDLLPPERELAAALEVGRSSLREALAGLVALGILKVGSRKGYQIASLTSPVPALPAGLSRAQIAELFEARQVLETGIAELACLRATEEDFAALQKCLDSIRHARRNHRSTAQAAARFHLLLARAAHNSLLEKQLEGVRDLMVQVGGTTEQDFGSKFASEQWEAHRVLLETLQRRDPAAMRAAVQEHLRRFAEEATPVKTHE
jgi:DNA-binding FadR family transcriptional regulator